MTAADHKPGAGPWRHRDWEARLEHAVLAWAKRRHDWKEQHCGRFVGAVLEAITGEDPGAALWGAIQDEASARALMAQGGGMEALVTARLGPPLDAVLHAVRGDVLLAALAADGGDCLGICDGHRGLFLGPRGIGVVPLKYCRVAWHIPSEEFRHLHRNVLKSRHYPAAPTGAGS